MVCLLHGTGRTEAAWPQEKPPAKVRIVPMAWPDHRQPDQNYLMTSRTCNERRAGEDGPCREKRLADFGRDAARGVQVPLGVGFGHVDAGMTQDDLGGVQA